MARLYNPSEMLRFPTMISEAQLRLSVQECGRICYGRGLMSSSDGNISVRVDQRRILITPAGACKGRMMPDDLVLLDLLGEVLDAPRGLRASSETPMHLEVYRCRPQARAVIHAHPVFATALTVAGLGFPSDVLPEILLTIGEVPVTDYATPSSSEDAEAIRPLIAKHAAILLRQHGALTAGLDLEEALQILERIEHVAEVYWRAHALGTVERLTPEARERLAKLRGGNAEHSV